MDRQTDRLIDQQTDPLTDAQTDRPTNTMMSVHITWQSRYCMSCACESDIVMTTTLAEVAIDIITLVFLQLSK